MVRCKFLIAVFLIEITVAILFTFMWHYRLVWDAEVTIWRPETKYHPSNIKLIEIFITCGLQVQLQAVLSILLATFAGLGVSMSGSSIFVEFFRWRRRSRAQSEQRHGSQAMTQPSRFPRSLYSPQIGAPERIRQSQVENWDAFRWG